MRVRIVADGEVDDLEMITVGDVDLEVDVLGEGEPVVIIQTALTADELRPLAERTAARGPFRVVYYYRRGYAGSGSLHRPASVTTEAADCRALITALDIAPAHVVGVSYSAAIALALASSAPETVQTVTVIEPPPVRVPSDSPFLAATAKTLEAFNTDGPLVALDKFMTMLAGPDWSRDAERDAPGSVAAMQRDATTFFESDVPALLSWDFDAEDAAAIRCPVYCVGGSESGPWFAEARTHLLRLLPHAESTVVEGGGHLLAATHASGVASLLVDFLRRHRSAVR